MDICDIRQILQFITLLFQADEPVTVFFHRQTCLNLTRNTTRRLLLVGSHYRFGEPITGTHNSSYSQTGDEEFEILGSLLAAFTAMKLAKNRVVESDSSVYFGEIHSVWELAIHKTASNDALAVGKQL